MSEEFLSGGVEAFGYLRIDEAEAGGDALRSAQDDTSF
jgi:hypothetical protein